SMITDEDESIKRVIRMIKENKVKTITGIDIPIKVDSICVHGDGAKALEFVRKIKAGLEEQDIKITPLYKLVSNS
ncbi:LamB/YcsF family protein, partial [Clostridium saccharobutylicum]